MRKLWIKLTYWSVPCSSCKGTGICQTLQAGKPPSVPHSCCGDCERKTVPATEVPADFSGISGATATVGSGTMYRRPWAKEQVQKPV